MLWRAPDDPSEWTPAAPPLSDTGPEPAALAPEPVDTPAASPVLDPQDPQISPWQQSLVEGLKQGLARGMEEGRLLGHAEGHQEGLQEGLLQASQQIQALCQALTQACSGLVELQSQCPELLTQWVYQTACRLAGRLEMDRSFVVQAVQEAMGRLPQAHSTWTIHLHPADLATWGHWSDLAQPTAPDFQLQADEGLRPGHAIVEVDGFRVDVGRAARDQLVRQALGLSDEPRANTETGGDDGR